MAPSPNPRATAFLTIRDGGDKSASSITVFYLARTYVVLAGGACSMRRIGGLAAEIGVRRRATSLAGAIGAGFSGTALWDAGAWPIRSFLSLLLISPSSSDRNCEQDSMSFHAPISRSSR